MTMELVKLWQLLAASFLCLTFLTDPTAACSCAPGTPQKAYCSTPFVLKVRVEGPSDNQNQMRRYKITITRVLKTPEKLKTIRSISTPLDSNSCGYEHPTPFNNDEYVFTAKEKNEVLFTTSCDFHRKWDDLSAEEKRGFEGEFAKSCG